MAGEVLNLEEDAADYTRRAIPRDIEGMSQEIRELARARNAVILAHNYQVPEVQDVADYVGDSLGLSRQAAATDADMIVFCGVHFMAETAVILSPTKRVLIPDLEAGCSLAATINATQLAAWKAEHPGAVVVSYVNTTAEVKALSDYCCTSGNAERVIRAIPEDKEILFLPDMFLGTYLEKVTGRKMHVWPGECHVHAGIRPADIDRARAEHGDADRTHILSTEGMVRHAQQHPTRNFVVATELGIMHRLAKEAPQGRFYAASEHAICRYMKKITLEKLLISLRDDVFEVTVPEDVADRARGAIQRMVDL